MEPQDLVRVSDMAARCSRETIHHRFHGIIDLPTYLASLLTSDQTTIVATSEECCLGLASLAPGPEGHEMAVLVEDRWQGRGVGAALFEALVDLARRASTRCCTRMSSLRTSSPFASSRYGRLEVALEYGVYSVLLHLEAVPA